jgi:hypothetical protein
MYQPYMVAMSHLSDAQELIARGMVEDANKQINFAKWLISKYRTDMVSEFDADAEWIEFSKPFL